MPSDQKLTEVPSPPVVSTHMKQKAMNLSMDKQNILWMFYYNKRNPDPQFQVHISILHICFSRDQFVIERRKTYLALMLEVLSLDISGQWEVQVSL